MKTDYNIIKTTFKKNMKKFKAHCIKTYDGGTSNQYRFYKDLSYDFTIYSDSDYPRYWYNMGNSGMGLEKEKFFEHFILIKEQRKQKLEKIHDGLDEDRLPH